MEESKEGFSKYRKGSSKGMEKNGLINKHLPIHPSGCFHFSAYDPD
jgi:hypothetical protein